MKYLYLSISIILTLFAFSMSLASGEVSGELSSSFSISLYQLFIEPIQFIHISFETFHMVIRKMAHITEYFLLGYFWIVTLSKFKIQIGYVFMLGLLIAFIDEGIQLFSLDRGPSLVDVFFYDYLSFFVGSLVSSKHHHISLLKK